MNHPFKRTPAAQPAELEDGIELSEGQEDSDWALWEDSVQQYESGAIPLDPFERISRRDR